ncbi:TonB-dependent receptor [Acidicapsa acidisoli]|uniref:TonB-dependent receptor n=1 Tax=Acidicapsa acidisoli TaxID=1615681 RepID=UPI0021DFA9B3|nr:TonB-dependent receptor [Acidicapsa acidisoli]
MGLDRKIFGWFRSIGCLTLVCVCFLLVSSQKALGQVDEGSITGTVLDSSGAVVPGAHVTLLNTDQGLSIETLSNGSGGYSFSPVRIGHYKITVSAKGFETTTQENLTVAIAQNLGVNIQLKPGAATETVEITEAPPLLQTEDASVGQVVDEHSVNSLPLNGRNFTFLAQLGAGMQTPQADTRGNAASGAFSANGLRPAQNNYLLDGIDNNSNAVDFLNGTNFSVLPPIDAIAEFKVESGDFSAEQGRAAGAIMNATVKSGTNSFHGDVWEYFRNDVLDAADFFESTKSELRLNQFGATAGGPIWKNKFFFFGDYEGKRRVQGNTSGLESVPTPTERSSGYANLTDILTANAGSAPRTDALGRSIPVGVVMDPSTTRTVTAGVPDPTTGIVAATTGYARDPFGYNTCTTAGLTAPSLAACPGLNTIPSSVTASTGFQDATKILNLFPNPTRNTLTSNFQSSYPLYEHSNTWDTREDFNPSAKDQIFVRFSYVDDPQFIPGPFEGIADGGSFQQGIQTLHSDQAAAAYTHVFTPTTINVGRVGFNHLHTTRFGPDGTTVGIPAQYNIQGIPQLTENGGLPGFTFGGLGNLGSNNFLPSDEVSQTLQVTDDFTKIYGKHSFKMGIEYQHVKFQTLQPAYSHGQFDYNGSFTDVPNLNSSTTGIAQFLIPPVAATVANGINYSGGSDQVQASNISTTYDERNYFAAYLQDDFKISPKLTLNLGLRYDYFGPIGESNGGQANFVPYGLPNNVPEYLIPATGKDNRTLSNNSTSIPANTGFVNLLAQDGITLMQTNKYGNGLVQTQKTNFAPRFGVAYQVTPKLVVRGGYGIFYNSFENQGYGPNIGENYPFVYNFNFVPRGSQSEVAPVSSGTPFAGCTPTGAATFESMYSCISFTPAAVDGQGLSLEGLQFNYQTPLTQSANVTAQYSLTHSLSAQVSYVITHGEHLQTGIGSNNVSALWPAGHSTTDPYPNNEIPFPDFSQGQSYNATLGTSTYNGLQTKVEEQMSNGLQFLFAYTWAKTLSDAGDLLNGGSAGGYRAPNVVGYGIGFDRGLADFDIRQVLHFSGGYQLPFGKDKQFLHNSNGLTNALVGGWSVNWIATLQGGQPMTMGCPSGTTAGTGCDVLNVPGQSQKLGIHIVGGQPTWFGNPAAFNQPCQTTGTANNLSFIPGTPAGCIATQGTQVLGGYNTESTTPGFRRLDFSTFKAFQLTERFSLLFRAEFFNILNHPNFNAPGFGGNGVVSIANSTNFTNSNFGEIGSTRDAPFDPRQIQFALKLYY